MSTKTKTYVYLEYSDHSNNGLGGLVAAKTFKTLKAAKKFRANQIHDAFAVDPLDDDELHKTRGDLTHYFGGYEFKISTSKRALSVYKQFKKELKAGQK